MIAVASSFLQYHIPSPHSSPACRNYLFRLAVSVTVKGKKSLAFMFTNLFLWDWLGSYGPANKPELENVRRFTKMVFKFLHTWLWVWIWVLVYVSVNICASRYNIR